MSVIFTYDHSQDISCLLTYGKTSLNSPTLTKIYKELVAKRGENLSEEIASDFIHEYVSQHNIKVEELADEYSKDWNVIADIFQKRAEWIFQIALPKDITAYLTINDRFPYSIKNNYFFVSTSPYSMRLTVMHELWHFYTWYKFGVIWEQKIGKEAYNDIKEALTVVLNIVCKDLLPQDIQDEGYSQHQELRNKILEIWSTCQDIEALWEKLVL